MLIGEDSRLSNIPCTRNGKAFFCGYCISSVRVVEEGYRNLKLHLDKDDIKTCYSIRSKVVMFINVMHTHGAVMVDGCGILQVSGS